MAKKNDIKKINHKEKNFIKIFKLFLNTKYIWGGKTYKGIDCSALVQIFYYYNNSFYPRDTKDQIKYSKKNINKRKFKKDINSRNNKSILKKLIQTKKVRSKIIKLKQDIDKPDFGRN